jgi:hypothetical protein
MITQDQVQWAVDILLAADEAAKARAAAEWMDDQTKSVLAEIMREIDAKSIAEREMIARSMPSFRAHLEALKQCRAADYAWRNKRSAAEAIIEAWRTYQSNQRTLERVR